MEGDHSLSGLEQQYLVAGRLMFLWERLRIVYNIILCLEAVVIFVFGVVFFAVPIGRVIAGLVIGGVVANACFCVGPVVDNYAGRFGLRSSFVTWTLFVLGTGFAVVLGLIFLEDLAWDAIRDD
ncbi:MAG: hypothetical protein GX621_16085 [Pirellulaceae bacterium]|nr:hypothetical protein [Pirellulaceae bacterium]